MNDWNQWKIKYKKQIEHVAGYEEAFVDTVLANIPEVVPDDVIPQYHFSDDNGKNRYIDFMIINKAKGYYLPIELDGTYKDTDHQRWKDFLNRQNSLITKFGIVLRFSNRQMLFDSESIIEKISHTLYIQSTKKVTEESKIFERQQLKEWFENKIQELEDSKHGQRLIESEINQLKVLVEEIRSPKQLENKGESTYKKPYKVFSSFGLGVSVILSSIIALGFFTWSNTFQNDSNPKSLSMSNDTPKADANFDGHQLINQQAYIDNEFTADLRQQGRIEVTQVRGLIGTTQVVCGVISEVRPFSRGTYLYFSDNRSGAIFRGVVWDSDKDSVLRNGEYFQHYLNKRACVKGEITEFNQQPQIVVKNEKQLDIY